MKLRLKGNSLRLRLNQSEVRKLAAGLAIEEHVLFPGPTKLVYVLRADSVTAAHFQSGVITVSAPLRLFQSWADSDEIGLYFDMPAGGDTLQVAVEKDLECIDGPPSERDPDAFPRQATAQSC